MKKILENLSRYRSLILVVFALSIIIALFGFKLNNDTFWQNYWAVEAAVITALLAVFGIIIEIDSNAKEKKQDKELEEKQKANDTYEETLKMVNLEGSTTLIEWKAFLDNNQRDLDTKTRLKSQIVVVLYQYSILKKSSEDLLKVDSEANISDYIQDRNLLREIIAHNDFQNTKNEIETEFPDLVDIIQAFQWTAENGRKKEADKNTDNSKSNTKKTEDSEDKKYPYILGDWIMKKEYAQQVEYVVGVSMSNRKKIVAIYDVKSNSNKNNRVRFDGKLIYDQATEEKEEVEILENWNSRNPVLYYNIWSKNLEENNKLVDIINKFSIRKTISEQDSNWDRKILVVATNQYNEQLIERE